MRRTEGERFDRAVMELKAMAARRDSGFRARLEETIRKNIPDSGYTVDILASDLCISRSALFSKVKECTGSSPGKLLLEARMVEAERLKNETGLSLDEISALVGFDSPDYFKTVYRRYFGLSD